MIIQIVKLGHMITALKDHKSGLFKSRGHMQTEEKGEYESICTA